MPEQYANDFSTTLNGGITDTATALTLQSATGAPVAPFRLRVEDELIWVGARSGVTCSSLTRHIEGTAAVAHNTGVTVEQVLSRGGLFNSPGIHDIRAYGALGDPTDDSAAIQAAIAAANAEGGGMVYIPAGGWDIGTAGLTIPGDNIAIKGAGRQATRLFYHGSSGGIRNSDTSDTKWQTTFDDFGMYSDDFTGTASLILLQNMMETHGRNILLQSNYATATGTSCLRIQGDPTWSTYYSTWSDIQFSAKGTCVLMDGAGQANIHTFINFTFNGNDAIAYKSLPTTYNQGGHRFINGTAEGLGGSPAAFYLGSSGDGASTKGCSFFNVSVELCTAPFQIDEHSEFNTIERFTADNVSGDPIIHANVKKWTHWAYLEVAGEGVDHQPMSDNGGYSRPWALKLPTDSATFNTEEDTRCYYDTATHRLYIRDGGAWRYVTTSA